MSWNQISKIVGKCLAFQEAGKEFCIATECGGDQSLAAEVQRVLEAKQIAESKKWFERFDTFETKKT